MTARAVLPWLWCRTPFYDLKILDQELWSKLLGLMIAAARLESIPARTPWPMHASLRELDEEAGRLGLRSAVGVDIRLDPSPECGLAARGADEGFRQLVRAGLLVPAGEALAARWLVDSRRLVSYRRALMTLDPMVVGLLQRAGSRWAALASTVAKNSDAEATSVAEIRSSATV